MNFRLPTRALLNTFCLVIFVSFLSVISLGCQSGGSPVGNPLSNLSVSPSDDLTDLLKMQAKTTLYEPQYRTIGDLRGICEFKAFPGDINTIANAFDMSEIKSETLDYIKYDEKASRLGILFKQGKDVRAYGVFGHPAKLKCKSGKSLEYMVIFYKPDTNEASIETCYIR